MNRDKAGYSLLEVLIAFAIMALVLSVLIPGQARLQIRSGTADETFLATDYALSRLDQLGVSEEISPGIVEKTYRNWQVIQTVSPEAIAGTDSQTFRIILVISNPAGRQLARVEALRLQ